MKTMDEQGRRLCRFQGKVFVLSAHRFNCSSPIFIRRFMFSQTAARIDQYQEFPEMSEETVLDRIEEEFGHTDYGQIVYSEEVLYWIGYMYRYWSYTKEISSKKVYRIIKPEEWKNLYYVYHTMDPDAAIARIMEAKNISEEEDYTTLGVQILRSLLAAESK